VQTLLPQAAELSTPNFIFTKNYLIHSIYEPSNLQLINDLTLTVQPAGAESTSDSSVIDRFSACEKTPSNVVAKQLVLNNQGAAIFPFTLVSPVLVTTSWKPHSIPIILLSDHPAVLHQRYSSTCLRYLRVPT
jgi:hypothetical protein